MYKLVLNAVKVLRKSRIYVAIRMVLFSLFLLGIGLYAFLYLIISLPPVQRELRGEVEKQLTALLGAEVDIDRLTIKPFKQFVAYDVDVSLKDSDSIRNRQILHIRELGAGLSLYQLLFKQRMVFTYAEILGLDVHLWRDTDNAPLNIEPIIARFKSQDNNKSKKYDLKIYNIVIRQTSISYDVLDTPADTVKFDKNHIRVDNLTADVLVPAITPSSFKVWVKRLALKERSGFNLTGLSAQVELTDTMLRVKDMKIALANSYVEISDIEDKVPTIDSLKYKINDLRMHVSTQKSYVCAADFAPFVPALSNFDEVFDFKLDVTGTVADFEVKDFVLSERNGLVEVSAQAKVLDLPSRTPDIKLNHLDLNVSRGVYEKIASSFGWSNNDLACKMDRLGDMRLIAKGNLTVGHSNVAATLSTELGVIDVDIDGHRDTVNAISRIKGSVKSEEIQIGEMFPDMKPIVNKTGLEMNVQGILKNKKIINLALQSQIVNPVVDGRQFATIEIEGAMSKRKIESGEVKVMMNDSLARVKLYCNIDRDNDNILKITSDASVALSNLQTLLPSLRLPDYDVQFSANASLQGHEADDMSGSAFVNNLSITNSEGKSFELPQVSVYAFGTEKPKSIILDSDVFRANISGDYHFGSLVSEVKHTLVALFPSVAELMQIDSVPANRHNQFSYEALFSPSVQFNNLFKMPIQFIEPVRMSGSVDGIRQFYSFYSEIPYILQKDKIIEGSRVSLVVNGTQGNGDFNVSTTYPVKRGNVDLNVSCKASDGVLLTDLDWKLNVAKAFHGTMEFATTIGGERNSPVVSVDVQKSTMVFNDTAWTIEPAHIDVVDKTIIIDGFEANCDKQFIKIDGLISSDIDDQLYVNLHDINLDYVFETLDIPNVKFGGRGTGEFRASNLFSKIPTIATEQFYVENFSYNDCILGNTSIASRWNNSNMGIDLDARINQHNGELSTVQGAIFPTQDSLYLDFNVHHTPVEFLLPYMQAFTGWISGTASGRGTLFGKFKTINFKGDLLAEDFKLRIDYLNTVYSCSDSIHIKPDYISLDGLTIKDKFGHTARMDGYVKHKAFHDASMDISISGARNLLCYDITASMNPNWYGTIYGNGNASVKGSPGTLDIDVNMSSARGSSFTFVMSDREAASDFDFITFSDRNQSMVIETLDLTPESVKQIRYKKNTNDQSVTVMNVNVQAEITPDINITLIMDPEGGDKIRTIGHGSMSMGYRSVDNDFYMRGKYTLDKGSYNFTLQDIIIKDFTIKEGSTITFQGNPEDAELDITAVYQLNASLTDLDDSFAMDKELNRTNVPVQAVLKASGDIEQPMIKFDLNFPTLSDEAYRKVKSIVSTDDMMNRQILYLLALSRFYTPEYMSASNNNNEFANVASSTISSQLSSILGQLSDNWSIAPNFRTNKGDFSDMEVDVALTSQLLNNRLLLNGNFGYRDNSMNNSSTNFIGDFDIEYLLNRSGNIRLKAYNHYNDQNYYIKSALTTQGVGVVFKYDFDKPIDLVPKKLRYKMQKSEK